MAGAKEHFPRWQPLLCALRRCRRSARPRCRSGVACALAEEGRADASVDLPVARRHGARGAKRADGVRAPVGQSRHASDCIHDLRHTYSTLLLHAGAPSPASASSPDVGTPRSLRSTLIGCPASIGSTRYNRTQPPRNRRRFRHQSTQRKSFVLRMVNQAGIEPAQHRMTRHQVILWRANRQLSTDVYRA